MGSAIDPSGFQISAVIRTVDGAKVNLWMKGSGGDDAASLVEDALSNLPAPGLGGMGSGSDSGSAELLGMDLPYVESVDVELSLGLSARIALNFACPFDVGLRLLETSLFQIGNTIEVQMGYPKLGRFTPWVSALMSKPSIRINGDEGLSVVINGDGGGFASMRGTSSRVYEGKSYKEIIKDIADRHKWAVEFPGDTGFDLASVLSAVGGGDDPLDETHERISQDNLSDWFLVQRLARTAGCDAFLGPNEDGKRTLFVKRRKETLSEAPKYQLMMRGNPDFDRVFPILNFESEAEGVWLPGAAVQTRSRDIDPDDGSVTDETASADTTEEASLGNTGVPGDGSTQIEGETAQLSSANGGNDRTGEYMTISQRDPRGQKAVVQAHRDEAIIRGGINALISTYGIPDLFPASLIEVTGLGIFNANYYIESLTWAGNSTEFVSRLKCINNASASGMFASVFLVDPASTNTEQAPVGEEADSGGALNAVARAVG